MTFVMAGGEKNMKKGIHPEYKDTTFICSCGNKFTAKSNKDEVHIEICSKCHPFYTGQQSTKKLAGNVEKFNKKYGYEK